MQKNYAVLFVITVLFLQSFADRSVIVFSRDEGFAESNISKPRIYIKNTGTEALTSLHYYYYFTTENGKLPIFDDYYSPDVNITIEHQHDSLYRVKYDFSGTILPGSMYPSEVENVIGLHYPDWSPWNKENDYSKSFGTYVTFVNAQIPVYDETNTLLFGIEPSDTGSGGTTPPDPGDPIVVLPAASFPMGYYAVFGTESVNLRDRDTLKNGKVGSNTYVEVGCDALVRGDIVTGGNLFLRERASIDGAVQIAGALSRQNGTSVTGAETHSTQFEQMQLPVVTVTPGTVNKIIPVNQTQTINPGAYDTLIAYAGATVKLKPGSYSFRNFQLEPYVHLIAELNGGAPIIVNILKQFRFADQCQIEFPAGKEYPMALQFYTAQSTQVFIGNQAIFKGIICAPNAEIAVNSRTKVFGGIYGKKVLIEPNVIICKPPVLADLYHSEITFARTFDPLNMFYTTIISPDVTTLNVLPVAEKTGITVTVDGHSPTTPVTLSGITNDITILLSDASNCSASRYLLRVQRSPNYMIYVNDDSPCSPGAEDGESWATAWKDLQKALVNAAITGREIWVAEGTYKPSLRTISSDPRSATFMVKPGTELKGGYNGTESENPQRGSVYNTHLSGDLSANDMSILNWPPITSELPLLDENAYHVITVAGNLQAKSILIRGFLIQNGYANTMQNSCGAGIYNNNCSPEIEWCGVRKNISNASGAGIYDHGGIPVIKFCLFQDNIIRKGSGAGIYTNSASKLSLISTVFSRNTVLDTSSTSGGSLGLKYADVEITNCLFTRNTSNGGGALFADSSSVKVLNCTFSDNVSVKPGYSITNKGLSTCNIRNSIIWNGGSGTEIYGTGITVEYSCVKNGYPGTGNITVDPLFKDPMLPEGTDGLFGSSDDGLRLVKLSPCVDILKTVTVPDADLLLLKRPWGDGSDMGAYEYEEYSEPTDNFGYLRRDGVFVPRSDIDIVDVNYHWKYIRLYSKSDYARDFRLVIPKNQYTEKKNEMYVLVHGVRSDGTVMTTYPEVRIDLYKIDENDNSILFQARTLSKGKVLLFVDSDEYHNWPNLWAYVIYTEKGLNISVPHSQFR